MGNRAIIKTLPIDGDEGISLYIHWNGGRSSIEGFLLACKELGWTTSPYLVTAIGMFFGSGLSIYMNSSDDCDDNGVWVVDMTRHRIVKHVPPSSGAVDPNMDVPNPSATRAIADDIIAKARAAGLPSYKAAA